MKALNTAIDHLYHTFEHYTTYGIHHCDCGCIDEASVRKLHSKPLKQLEEEHLIAYHLSALYTWGDVKHYKHYLPRICELLSQHEGTGFIDIDELYIKLDYAKWTNWPINEQQAIKEFITSNWFDLIKRQDSENNAMVFAFHEQLIDIQVLIKLWQKMEDARSLKSFVYFYDFYITQTKHESYTLELNQFLDTSNILEVLENAFFDIEKTDASFAKKISYVHQMIEVELKRSVLKQCEKTNFPC